MSGPWEDYAPQDAGPWADYAAPAQEAPAKPPRTTGQEIKRQLGLTARIGAEAVGAIPLAAMDFGVGARNLLTGSKYESPSAMYSQGLDRLFGPRETGLEQAVGIAGNVLVGSKIPAPQGPSVPSNFMPRQSPRMETFTQARNDGYVAPPTTVAPSVGNRVAEGLAGKLTTAQMAAQKNQNVTNRLAARALGLSDDAQITPESIQEVRRGAIEAYRVIRSAGTMQADDEFRAALTRIESTAKGAEKSFPGLAKNPISDDLAALRQESFEADSAVDAIRLLRDNADDAFRQGKGQIGTAYRDMAKALEGAIERNLQRAGDDGAEMLKQYRDARTLLAKTYSVSNALNEATGNIDAAKLARELGKGKPLSGELERIARFAQGFPKAAKMQDESMPGISPLDFYASGGIAAGSGNPAALAIPVTRLGARNALLSEQWQNALIPKPYEPWNKLAMGLGYGAPSVLSEDGVR